MVEGLDLGLICLHGLRKGLMKKEIGRKGRRVKLEGRVMTRHRGF